MLKRAVKSLILSTAPQVLDRYRTYRAARHERLVGPRMARLKQDMCFDYQPKLAVNDVPQHILIIPSDPAFVFGALGDDAMLGAAMSQARMRNPAARFTLMTANRKASTRVTDRGHEIIEIWEREDFVEAFRAYLEDAAVDRVVLIGADVMDGSYGEFFSLKMVVAANVAAIMGIPTAIMGFSFGEKARPGLAEAFDRLDPGVTVNVRDELSTARFKAFTKAPVTPVADSAFCLEPDDGDPEFSAWCARQRGRGKRLLGINLHPMLFTLESEKHAAVENMIETLDALCARFPEIALVPISHDCRELIGDYISLDPIHAHLATAATADSFYLKPDSARTVKTAVALLDGVVTGRMHLSIACLGQGVPVFCFSYNGKFEGLLDHFHLPRWLAQDGRILLDQPQLQGMIERFVTEQDGLKQLVTAAWPTVKRAAERNFVIFDPRQG